MSGLKGSRTEGRQDWREAGVEGLKGARSEGTEGRQD